MCEIVAAELLILSTLLLFTLLLLILWYLGVTVQIKVTMVCGCVK